jgi:glutaredoxin
MNAIKTAAATAVFTLITASLPLQTHGQQLYKIVGPDGKVTFSDQPPSAAAGGKVIAGRAGSLGNTTAADTAAPNAGNLPLDVRTAASKAPVTLYTSKDCAPCGLGRSLLAARGVPFSEKTVDSVADNLALRKLTGDTTMPVAIIGGVQLKGFSESQWTDYLDAAGYPKTSALPSSYRNPVATSAAPQPPASAPAATLPPQPTVQDISPKSDAKGIQF